MMTVQYLFPIRAHVVTGLAERTSPPSSSPFYSSPALPLMLFFSSFPSTENRYNQTGRQTASQGRREDASHFVRKEESRESPRGHRNKEAQDYVHPGCAFLSLSLSRSLFSLFTHLPLSRLNPPPSGCQLNGKAATRVNLSSVAVVLFPLFFFHFLPYLSSPPVD